MTHLACCSINWR